MVHSQVMLSTGLVYGLALCAGSTSWTMGLCAAALMHSDATLLQKGLDLHQDPCSMLVF